MGFLITSCSNDDNNTTEVEDINEGTDFEQQVEVSIHTQLFKQLKSVGDLLETGNIWAGFDFKSYPLYLIHKDENGIADKAFVINPQSEIPNATMLNEKQSAGINVLRYDQQMQEALDLIQSDYGNGLYEFDFEINNGKKILRSNIHR